MLFLGLAKILSMTIKSENQDPIFRRSKIKNNIFHTAAPANQVFSSNHQLNWTFSLSFSPPQQQNIPSPSGTGKRPISKLASESASSSG